jgi:hypothetical protein
MSEMSISTRGLAAAVASAVVFDAVWVRAPFLAVIAVPFVITAWRYREGRLSTRVAFGLWCALYVLIGVTFALSNGLHAPTEPNTTQETINAGDFVFVYLGTPIAAWLLVRLASRSDRRRQLSGQAVSA